MCIYMYIYYINDSKICYHNPHGSVLASEALSCGRGGAGRALGGGVQGLGGGGSSPRRRRSATGETPGKWEHLGENV